MRLANVLSIIQKDINIELRQSHALAGIFLFAITTVYIVYKTFNKVAALEWNILVWLILLFAGLNAIVKSFVQERKETYLYYYTIFNGLEVIVAKLIYNFIFTLFLALVIIGTFTVLLGNPVKDFGLFFQALFFGVLGISSVFTFVSSVTGAGNSSGTMMSILALPLILPSVLTMERVTAVAMRLINDSTIQNDIYILMGIDMLVIGVILLIFPTLWKS